MNVTEAPLQSLSLGRVAARKQRTRAAILISAARLFTEQGYETTTMQEIASLADVGLGTMYGYFPSKEDVLRTIVESRREEAAAQISNALRGTHGTLRRVSLFLDLLWEHLAASRQLSLALLAIDAARPDGGSNANEGTYRALAGMLRYGKQRGEIADVPVETTARALLSAYTWAALQLGLWRDAQNPNAVKQDLAALTLRLLDGGPA